MRIFDGIGIALVAIRTNALRSLLTLLGIVIGVAAVITTVAIGSGAQERLQQQAAALGSNLLMITPSSRRTGGVQVESNQFLTEADAYAIEQQVPGVVAVGAQRQGGVQVVSGRQNARSRLEGVTTGYMEAREWWVTSGRTFSGSEIRQGGLVVLLGRTVATELFGDADPIGQVVRLNRTPATVIGLLNAKGQTSWGQDQDRIVMVPLAAARRLLGANQAQIDRVDTVVVKMETPDLLAPAQEEIRGLLMQRLRVPPGAPEPFEVRNLTEFLNAAQEQTRVFSVLIAAVGSVSLIVGGIGIMNIMLVSVTERTREIGLRLAVGARPSDIMGQFLIEAVTLSVIGGAIGVALGIGASAGLASATNFPTLIQPQVILMAVLISAGVGILFGIMPARRAAKLDPIEALRFE